MKTFRSLCRPGARTRFARRMLRGDAARAWLLIFETLREKYEQLTRNVFSHLLPAATLSVNNSLESSLYLVIFFLKYSLDFDRSILSMLPAVVKMKLFFTFSLILIPMIYCDFSSKYNGKCSVVFTTISIYPI